MLENPVQTYISRLEAINFRNYTKLSITTHPGMILFTGKNGSGKTNLLEAVSFFSPGKGLRRADYAEVARQDGPGFFSIHAETNGPFGAIPLGTGTIFGGAEKDIIRQTRINKTKAKSSEAFLEWLRIIWLTPSMDRIFSGPSAERRRFLDFLVLNIHAGHAHCLLDYERAMRSRNRLLQCGSQEADWFKGLEIRMAETGTAIAAARVETVYLLSETLSILPKSSPFPRACLALSGILENMLLSSPAVDVEEFFVDFLAKKREQERAAGRTLEGPHRSDLHVSHHSQKMEARLCSTGEQKALLIGIILSHARLCAKTTGILPILLLDEITAHLDMERRNALFVILENLGCQTFMTGTETWLFESLRGRAQFFSVHQGAVFSEANEEIIHCI